MSRKRRDDGTGNVILWTAAAFVGVVVLINLSMPDRDQSLSHTSHPATVPRTAPTKNHVESVSHVSQPRQKPWYSGGTLHKATGEQWRRADRADKLATAADFVTSMWQAGNLKPSVAARLSTVEDVRPLAEELVAFLDTALSGNQTVAGTASVGMITLGWAK